ncbi:MAG: DUF3854 domain-containing protein, partial [Bacteroidales bacterium]|nr:DUF3854 domain-containing protein [Bacteroidales bacterium]
MNYLQQRLKELGVTDKQNKYKAVNIDKKQQEFTFFTSDSNDNVVINYLTPSGEIEYFSQGKKVLPFTRTRLKNPENPKYKYHQEKGTGIIPFSTPKIIEAYKKGEKVKTLYITEGEFKAFSVDQNKLVCFGIGGIHNFKDKNKNNVHPYIYSFIEKCKVENVVILFDADCLKVEFQEGKELTTRLNSFYSALNNFNEFLKPLDVSVYFAHIDTKSEQKGIDDVLSHVKDKDTVIDELKSLTVNNDARKYIKTYKITGISPYLILKIFGLDSVQTFFQLNFELLHDKEFI